MLPSLNSIYPSLIISLRLHCCFLIFKNGRVYDVVRQNRRMTDLYLADWYESIGNNLFHLLFLSDISGGFFFGHMEVFIVLARCYTNRIE